MGVQVAHVTLFDNSEQVKAMSKAARAKALEEIGLAGEKYAKEKCPVDTGNLRNSIKHTKDEDSAYIYTNTRYGKWVETGTSRSRAQPFIGPAATDHVPEYRSIVERNFKNA